MPIHQEQTYGVLIRVFRVAACVVNVLFVLACMFYINWCMTNTGTHLIAHVASWFLLAVGVCISTVAITAGSHRTRAWSTPIACLTAAVCATIALEIWPSHIWLYAPLPSSSAVVYGAIAMINILAIAAMRFGPPTKTRECIDL